MNGDVLTALDYGACVDVHREAGNVLTIASHRRVVRTDYGVLHLDGDAGETRVITGFEEKPEIPYMVSMGVYVLEPAALDYIEPGQRLDLPDLVLSAARRRRAGRRLPATTATGSTSGATRTTSGDPRVRASETL